MVFRTTSNTRRSEKPKAGHPRKRSTAATIAFESGSVSSYSSGDIGHPALIDRSEDSRGPLRASRAGQQQRCSQYGPPYTDCHAGRCSRELREFWERYPDASRIAWSSRWTVRNGCVTSGSSARTKRTTVSTWRAS